MVLTETQKKARQRLRERAELAREAARNLDHDPLEDFERVLPEGLSVEDWESIKAQK